MKYKITDINRERGWVCLTVTWDDGTTYDKRMMVPMDSEESICEAIENWMMTYAPMREAELNAYDPSSLVGKTTVVEE